MIHGGTTTIYDGDINASIDFYTKTMGLKLRMRAGDDWAEIDAGPGLIIGLHPAEGPHMPTPGTRGSLSIGFNVTDTLEAAMEELSKQGVSFGEHIVEDEHVRIVFFNDPDGNGLYLAQVLYVGAPESHSTTVVKSPPPPATSAPPGAQRTASSWALSALPNRRAQGHSACCWQRSRRTRAAEGEGQDPGGRGESVLHPGIRLA
jgi:catechol 2,3-dioxygenase-like lactoylglutathione lyase family enzyme